jgi:hypothetical protein
MMCGYFAKRIVLAIIVIVLLAVFVGAIVMGVH